MNIKQFYIKRIEYSIKMKTNTKSSKRIFVFILFISKCIKTRERERKPHDDKITNKN